MYWYYKLFFSLIIALIVGLGIYSFREELAGLIPAREVEEIKASPTEVKIQHQTPTSTIKISPAKPLEASIPTETTLWRKELDTAQALLDQQLWEKAEAKAQSVFQNETLIQFSKTWYRAAELIGQANSALLASTAPSKRKVTHIVKAGDSLDSIARGKFTVRGLQKANQIPLDIAKIFPNQILTFFPGEWSITAYKSEFCLLLFHQDRLFKLYKVGIGKEDKTPVAEFHVQAKKMNPSWQKTGASEIPFGHPDNPLGTRWMRLVSDERPELQGFGIHGTSEPNSIGTASSQGCLRMRNDDVEELFDIIPHKIKVIIKE